MKATELELVHFRSARQLESLKLGSGVNLLVGANGSGKSTILDAIAIMLSWATARLRSSKSSGRPILDTDIHNEKNFAWIELTCQTGPEENNEVSWCLAKTRKGRNSSSDPTDPLYERTNLEPLNTWATAQREYMGRDDENLDLPLFVYYPVNRAVLDIPLRIRQSHRFELLSAYEDALKAGTNFRSFFEWYRNREDLENERFREQGRLVRDPCLDAVREAIALFLPNFSNISVKRNPLRMEVTKDGETLRVDQMSDGEKCLFAMIGDLSRRLAIANPNLENPLHGQGIILIDEIELHLHPAWQRRVIKKLQETFPNCQFIISTHSPQIFGEVDAHAVRHLSIETIHGLVANVPAQALGLDASEILEENMGARSRNQETVEQLEDIFRLVDDNQFCEARECIEQLRERLHGNIPELVHAQSLITMLEPEEGAGDESN